MGYTHHHSHHGSVGRGRLLVIIGCVLVLVANGLVFKEAASTPRKLPPLEVITVISLVWMFAGAVGICRRHTWGRSMALAVLYAGSFGFFLTIIITLTGPEDSPMIGRLFSIYIADPVYIITSLVLTNSKDVRRLTSRAYE